MRFEWLRKSLRQIHLWIGIALGAAIIPLCISGAVLVFGPEIDRLINPSRYAVTSGAADQPAEGYLAAAAAASSGARVITLRWPDDKGAPMIAMLRGGRSGGTELAYLDPPTAKVLGVARARSSVVGFTHALHANLLVEDFGGRQLVGWIGLFLLAMTLSGLYLWWPRRSGFIAGLRWRRSPRLSGNLHHLLGFWIAGPFTLMILTGAYLSFPAQARALIGVFTELTPQAPRQGPGPDPSQRPTQEPQRVVDAALQIANGSHPLSLSLPAAQNRTWRVQVAGANGEARTVTVNDATGAATLQAPSLDGDAFAVWLRNVHDAKHHGSVWRLVAFLCGVVPAVLAVTGPIMWLRRRAAPSPRSAAGASAGLAPRQRARRRPQKNHPFPVKNPFGFHRADAFKIP